MSEPVMAYLIRPGGPAVSEPVGAVRIQVADGQLQFFGTNTAGLSEPRLAGMALVLMRLIGQAEGSGTLTPEAVAPMVRSAAATAGLTVRGPVALTPREVAEGARPANGTALAQWLRRLDARVERGVADRSL